MTAWSLSAPPFFACGRSTAFFVLVFFRVVKTLVPRYSASDSPAKLGRALLPRYISQQRLLVGGAPRVRLMFEAL